MRKFKLPIFRSAFLFAMLIIPLIIILTSSNKNAESLTKKPIAKDGVLDLRNWDFKRQGTINLDGAMGILL